MFDYLIKRTFQAIVVMFVISVISFAIQDNLGDPLRELVGQSVSEEVRNQLRDELGLNDGFFTQYLRFAGNALQGDLGTSYFYKKPALEVIFTKLPATLELVFCSTLIIVGLSIPMGVYSAISPRSIGARFIMAFSVIGISIPVFLTAIFAIYLFAVELQILPSFGRGDPVHIFGYWKTNFTSWSNFKYLLLPSISLASIMLPLFIRLIRSEMLEAMETEYVKFARAKGISPMRIWFLHAFKNTLLPVITVGGVQIGTMVAYTILTETVFSWPGMGFIFLEAINRVDTPLIVAYLIVVGLIFVVTNTIVDIIYGFVNPTVKLARMGS